MEIIKEYMLVSQFDGLRFIVADTYHWLERIFWICCVTISWTFSILFIKDYWNDFMIHPISLVIDGNHPTDNSSLFSVSVCEDMNEDTVFNLARKFYVNNSIDEVYFQNVVLEIAYFQGTGPNINSSCMQNKMECPRSNLREFASMARSSCEELFSRCSWLEEEFNCCDYFTVLQTELGLCYTFNSIQTNERREFPGRPDEASGVRKLGISLKLASKVYLHSPEDVPFSNAIEYLVFPASAFMSKKYTIRTSETVNDNSVRDVTIAQRACRYPEENPLWIYNKYSYSACVVQCRMERQISLCNCSSHLANFTKKPCDLEGLMCLEKHRVLFSIYGSDFVCDCLPTCNELHYDVIDLDAYGKFEETADVDIVLLEPSKMKMKRQVVQGLLHLFVSIGSFLNLFLGASVLCFVELFYYCAVRPCWNSIRSPKENPQLLFVQRKCIR